MFTGCSEPLVKDAHIQTMTSVHALGNYITLKLSLATWIP